DDAGEHPAPYTLVSADDVAAGRWKVNPAVAEALGLDPGSPARHLAPHPPRQCAAGRWKVTPAVAEALGLDPGYAARHLAHYTRRLAEGGKYDLTIWPYHAMLGGIGHALVSAVEEAVFFHGIARVSSPEFQVKGDNPLTEHYSMLG